jgi:RHS repeat-associated protein
MSSGHLSERIASGWGSREFVNGEEEKFLTTHHERDQETDLDYRGARFYDSDIGRFLSLDPLAHEFPSWSDYNYVLGNPITLIDPSGLTPEETDTGDKEPMSNWTATHLWLNSTFNGSSSSFKGYWKDKTEANKSLINAYSKVLESIATSRSESIIVQINFDLASYGNEQIKEKVSGYAYNSDRKELPFTNITLTIFGESLMVDEIRYRPAGGGGSIVTEVKEAKEGGYSSPHGSVEGDHVYRVLGIKAPKIIKRGAGQSDIQDYGSRSKRTLGFILLNKKQNQRLENILRTRTRQIVTNYINTTFKDRKRREKVIYWLKNKHIGY